MQLKHIATPIDPTKGAQGKKERISCATWSPNSQKLAICGKDKVIFLFDEYGELRDKFPTRPSDPKHGIHSYMVTGLAFSPCSTKIAVAQTDNLIFVYKIGEEFRTKKVISNKLPQPCSIVKLVWPSEMEIICGLVDGMLRHTPMLSPKNMRSKTFYKPEFYPAALVTNAAGTELASSHVDGRIAIFTTGQTEAPKLVVVITRNIPAYALTFGTECILAGGSDKKVMVYDKSSGQLKQTLDFSKDHKDYDFGSACSASSGNTAIFGSYNRLRILQWSQRKKAWEEGGVRDFTNVYTITTILWRKDGTQIGFGTSSGGFHIFESIFKRSINKNFAITYVAPSHVYIKIKESDAVAHIKSKYGTEIIDVRLMGKDNYALANTTDTLIICDIKRGLTSEIPWTITNEKEKYYFENPHLCMIFNDGEMTLVEYGKNDTIGTYRTPFANPHMISVRINERRSNRDGGRNNKKLAYLIDPKVISIVDLEFNLSLGAYTHENKIDWLELNETGTKLLFRDKKLKLSLVEIEKLTKHNLLNECSFVQWVPGSDVVVAQSRNNLYVWYHTEAPLQMVESEVKGVAFDVVKAKQNRTVVLLQDGNNLREFQLDTARIEFGTAIEEGDLKRALQFLESAEPSIETRTMWKNLAKLALENGHYVIAERSYCAFGDISKSKYLRDTIATMRSMGIKANGKQPTLAELPSIIKARMAIFNGELKYAEALYIENDEIDKAIDMYVGLHKWKKAINLSRAQNHPGANELVNKYLKYLVDTKQIQVAAEFLEESGNIHFAVNMFLDGGLPTKAAKIVENHPGVDFGLRVYSRISQSLTQGDFKEQAGDFFLSTEQRQKAIDCYIEGTNFEKAIKTTRRFFPDNVVRVEEEWGDYLIKNRHNFEAIQHYVEAGKLVKAVDASIKARQYAKGLQIIEVFDDPMAVQTQYIKLGDFFKSKKEISTAESCYLKIKDYNKAVDMYMEKGMWEDANRVALYSPKGNVGIKEKFVDMAKAFEAQKKTLKAEQLYLALKEYDLAIAMYGNLRMFDNMLKLVEKYHPEHVKEAYKKIAKLLEKEDNLKEAEYYLIKAEDYKGAVSMYQSKDLWEDAHRVARSYGGQNNGKAVLFAWALHLKGEMGIKLLKKYNVLGEAIEFMVEQKKYKYALEWAKLGAQEKLPVVYYKYGKYLEENGKIDEAESAYIAANKQDEAVEMLLKNKQTEKALKIAESLPDKRIVSKVLVVHALTLFENKMFTDFERTLVRAEKPDMVIAVYKKNGLWTEAFTFCKENIPAHLSKLQADFDNRSVRDEFLTDAEGLFKQAKEFEQLGEYRRAIDCYMKLNPTNIDDSKFLLQCWSRAGELAVKFLRTGEQERIVRTIGSLLLTIGGFSQASAIYLHVNLQQESIDALLAGNLWTEAKQVARDLGPRVEEYVREKHTESLRKSGQVDELVDVNLQAALDLLCEQGQWEKCLEKAKKQQGLLDQYLGRYAIHLLKGRKAKETLDIYSKYGVPTKKNHVNIYKGLALVCFASHSDEDYIFFGKLRNLLYEVVFWLGETDEAGTKVYNQLERLLLIAHYMANRAAFREVPDLNTLAAKVSISLLRYTNYICLERAFFEAGQDCKRVNWENMAFVYLNHYLDVHDAIEDGVKSTGSLDNSDLVNTDIPIDVELPKEVSVSSREHEETKEWVLTASMDRNIQQELKKDDRKVYEASLGTGKGGNRYEPCLITGYPVIGPKVQFKSPKSLANKEDWNKFVMVCKGSQKPEMTDIYGFIAKWCGSNPNYSF